MAKFKIIDVREIPSRETERIGRMDKLVTYQFDAFRTYVLTIPAEEFTEEKLKAEVAKAEAERAAWIGKELEV